jgi:lysophospholipase L1-like esterase
MDMTRTLLCYGDSNTHGTIPLETLNDLGRFPRDVRWTGQLAHLLPDWQVIEEGQPGRTTLHDDPVEGAHRNGLTVLPAILETHRSIDAVVLMLGTNDLKGRFSLSATDIALSLEKLVTVIRASLAGPGLTAPGVLLVAPPPIREVPPLGEIFWGGEAKSRSLGARIAQSAQRVHVPFLDAGTVVTVSEVDGIHYDADQQALLARAIAEAVRQHFG